MFGLEKFFGGENGLTTEKEQAEQDARHEQSNADLDAAAKATAGAAKAFKSQYDEGSFGDALGGRAAAVQTLARETVNGNVVIDGDPKKKFVLGKDAVSVMHQPEVPTAPSAPVENPEAKTES